MECVNVQPANGQVFAGRAGIDVEALVAEVVESLGVNEADRLHGGVVFVVIMAVADDPVGGDLGDLGGPLGDPAGRDIHRHLRWK